jgi:type VI secretion system secreted protein VgrG
MVSEAISRPYRINVEAIAKDPGITSTDIVGQAITCKIQQGAGDPRCFHGVVRTFGRMGDYGRGLTAYRFEAVPALWPLSQTMDCRIFQEKSVQFIVNKLLEEGQASATWLGSPPTTPRTYCVQYNETDLDFIQRLLDEVGYGYFYEQAAGSHTLKIASANANYPNAPCGTLVNRPNGDTFDSVVSWTPRTERQPGSAVLMDYDEANYTTPLKSEQSTKLTGGHTTSGELFYWPGGQWVRPDAPQGSVARLLMERGEAQGHMIDATIREPRVFAGSKVKIKPHDEGSETTYLVTAIRHEAFDETHLAGGGSSGYSGSLTLIDSATPWRDPMPKLRPRMPALQSAIVTGATADTQEEIYVDTQGRIKVKFLWDRLGNEGKETSCWLRVMQPYAGKWGGTWFLPRIGDEVIVGYLDDDPDKPIVVGSAFTQTNKPPWTLPDAGVSNRSGIVTRSTKNGGTGQVTEDGSAKSHILMFDDTSGKELFYVQAQKDHTIYVKHDQKLTIDNNQTIHVKNNLTETVDVDRTETVKGKHTEDVTKDRTVTIKEGNESLTVSKGNMTTKVETGNQENTVSKGNQTNTIEMGNQTVAIKMGNQETKLDLGKSATEAMQSIELKVGQSSVKIDQKGVTIKGMMITIEGQIQTEVKGVMVQINGSAMLKMGGGITMIG